MLHRNLSSAADDQLQDLVCPFCHAILERAEQSLQCEYCHRAFPIRDGIPDFRERDEYWCNVTREKMCELNKRAQETGDWLGSARLLIPEYCGHFVPFERADTQFMWPTTAGSRILDAGSMWGGMTVPVAQYHGEVYAVDKTIETLSFLVIRSRQMGFTNIHVAAASLSRLPLPDDFFDLVILNGVLEWVAFEQNVVLEKEWGKFGRGFRPSNRKRYTENPTAMQLNVLREIHRVLKPGGSLYLAIENRIGYQYFFGWPDDHVNLPFVGLLPRSLANVVTRIILKCDYRTYVYTIPGYHKLLSKAGFALDRTYGAFTHYISPQEVVPLDLVAPLKKKIKATKGRLHRAMMSFIPARLLTHMSPSVILFATKARPHANHDPRVLQLLKQAHLVPEDRSAAQIRVVKCDSREGNELTANFWIYNGDDVPRYFIKICRSASAIEVLERQAANLRMAARLLRGVGLDRQIPEVLAFQIIDGITFMVTRFIDAQDSGFRGHLNRRSIRLLDKRIRAAIRFLVPFQRHSTTSLVDAVPHLLAIIERQRDDLRNRGVLSDETAAAIEVLADHVAQLQPQRLPVCAQHGDFDFFKNILFAADGVRVLDFEHFESKGLPFLDLATLVFHPIFVSRDYVNRGLDLATIIATRGLRHPIASWLGVYAASIGLSRDLVALSLPVAALEQITKSYPTSRRPSSFPFVSPRALRDALAFRVGYE